MKTYQAPNGQTIEYTETYLGNGLWDFSPKQVEGRAYVGRTYRAESLEEARAKYHATLDRFFS